MTRPIRREIKRRAAIEPVISHLKAEHRMGRNHLKGRDGDRVNAVLVSSVVLKVSIVGLWKCG